jgi:hypothetical protein
MGMVGTDAALLSLRASIVMFNMMTCCLSLQSERHKGGLYTKVTHDGKDMRFSGGN